MNNTKITVESIIDANRKKAWEYHTQSEHITEWNFASDDWMCPRADYDLRVGGKMFSRMEAKDGSFGFDFEGVFTDIKDQESYTYELADGRQATTSFEDLDGKTKVTIVFDAENENPVEMQKGGWQAILNNFKKYVESN